MVYVMIFKAMCSQLNVVLWGMFVVMVSSTGTKFHANIAIKMACAHLRIPFASQSMQAMARHAKPIVHMFVNLQQRIAMLIRYSTTYVDFGIEA